MSNFAEALFQNAFLKGQLPQEISDALSKQFGFDFSPGALMARRQALVADSQRKGLDTGIGPIDSITQGVGDALPVLGPPALAAIFGAAGGSALGLGGEAGGIGANAGEGASYGANGSTVYGGAQSISGGGGLGGEQVYYDDYGNPLTNETGSPFTPSNPTPGVGDAGAFDQFGSANSPNGTVPGNIGDTYKAPGFVDTLKGYADKLGLGGLLKVSQGRGVPGAGGAGLPGGTDALTQIIAALGPAALGVIGSGQQTAAFERLANQYAGYGAPYRQRLSDLYANPSGFLQSPEVQVPVQQASDIAAHSLSTGGNPIASGNSLQQLQDYSANQLFGKLGQEKDRLAGFGGLSQYNAAAPGAATSAINANAGAFNAAGAGLANIFNPPQTTAQQLADFYRLSQGMTQ